MTKEQRTRAINPMWDGFDQATRACPDVLWTHTADMYVFKMLGV